LLTLKETLRSGLAVAGGLLWATCFVERPLLIVPWLALIPLILLLGDERPGLSGFLFGFAYWLLSIYWIAGTLVTYGNLPRWLALLSLLGLAVYLAFYCALFALLGGRLWRDGGASVLVTLPALWVALEVLRAHLLSGFPWNLAAYSWIGVPGALPTAAWVGAYGVSFLVVLANTSIARAVTLRSWRPAVWIVLGILGILALGARSSGNVGANRIPSGQPVRILQPNTENLAQWDAEQVRHNYIRLIEQSTEACQPGALLVWPESAAWPFAFEEHALLREDVRKLNERGCSVLLNSVARDGGSLRNAVYLVDSQQRVARYDKRHLVPFGEYVPLARFLPFLDKIARAAGDFTAGSSAASLPWKREGLGVSICFEIVFPGEVAATVRNGASLLVTVTNDAWYGDTSAPWQHFRAARFRGAENRRPLLRAAITGVSGLIAPDGRILQRLGVGAMGIIAAPVEGRSDLTPFTRWPWLVPTVCMMTSVFAILLSFRERGARNERPGR
jgi:apolipoprotein N-acyltransferase